MKKAIMTIMLLTAGPFILEAQAAPNAALIVTRDICRGIVSCYGTMTMPECMDELTGLPSTDQLDNELGLPEGSTANLQEIIDGVGDGTYTVNPRAALRCSADIRALSCADMDVGYDAADPYNFQNVENFLSCGRMLR